MLLDFSHAFHAFSDGLKPLIFGVVDLQMNLLLRFGFRRGRFGLCVID
jgi:hypothetical protein